MPLMCMETGKHNAIKFTASLQRPIELVRTDHGMPTFASLAASSREVSGPANADRLLWMFLSRISLSFSRFSLTFSGASRGKKDAK